MSAEWSTSVSQTQNERRSSHRIWQSLMAIIVGLIACPSIGCLSPGKSPADRLLPQLIDIQVEAYRDIVWAKRAYNLRYGNCDRQYGNHFRNGFIDGYCNVCEGNPGYVPAMPPESYWGSEYQCPEGAKCVNAWFEGFPAGAAAAKKDAAGKYRNVYISKMINSAITQEKQKDAVLKSAPNEEDAPQLVPATSPLKQEIPPIPSSLPATRQPLFPVEPATSAETLPEIIKPDQFYKPTDY